MTSEEYIIKLLQTIESLHSTMMAMREEIAFLRQQLSARNRHQFGTKTNRTKANKESELIGFR